MNSSRINTVGTTTLGTDPELPVLDIKGQVVPSGWIFDVAEAFNLKVVPPLEEGKGRYINLSDLGKGFKFYEDGASLEMNLPPVTSPTDMVDQVGKIMKAAYHLVTATGYLMDVITSVPITPEVIARGGVALSQFGCDPDTTVHFDNVDPAKVPATATYSRFYGGHIHVGTTPAMSPDWYGRNTFQIAVMCDYMVGLADILLDPSQQARTRRFVYGRAGRNRIQQYTPQVQGFEYRTPGNTWMRTKATTNAMFTLTQAAANLSLDDGLLDNLLNKVDLDSTVRAINGVDADAALPLFTTVREIIEPLVDVPSEVWDLPFAVNKAGGILPTSNWKSEWGL